MDDDAFRAVHARTARRLFAYLARVCRDRTQADDLLQETYHRFLAASLPPDMDEASERNYLYRIATNLLHDHAQHEHARADRDARLAWELRPEDRDHASGRHDLDTRRDVRRALDRLRPKDRQLLWLAYVERFSHKEIAAMLGFTPDSVRPLLFRARHKLAALLTAQASAAQAAR